MQQLNHKQVKPQQLVMGLAPRKSFRIEIHVVALPSTILAVVYAVTRQLKSSRSYQFIIFTAFSVHFFTVALNYFAH